MSTVLSKGVQRSRDGRLKEELYRAIKNDILTGVYDMGERLNESQLSARYGVSRAPLRQALTQLQGDGLVEVQPRVGYLTATLTLQDVSDIFDLRLLVEASTAEKAAARIGDAALDRLDQLCSGYQPGERKSYPRHLADNLEFHRIIADASGNRRLAQVLGDAMEHMLPLLILRLDRSTGDDVVEEHRAIAAALRRRDTAAARDLVVRHLEVARQATVDSILRLTASRQI